MPKPTNRWSLVITSIVVAAAFASSCRDATYVMLEVDSPDCARLHDVAIVVGSLEQLDRKAPESLKVGCSTARVVGTLVLYPSGADDAEFGVRAIAGVNAASERCEPPAFAGCIAYTRLVRFVPHEAQTIHVTLGVDCLDKTCASGLTCEAGTCIPIPGP